MPSNRPSKRAPARPFTVGSWLVDPATGQASRGSRVVRLRPQLVDLLQQLALHANETVSKEDLLDAVWADRYIDEAGVTRCIAELRQLLGDDPRHPAFIQTIPKRGYRLVAPVGGVADDGQPAGDAEAAQRHLAPLPALTGTDPAADSRPARRAAWPLWMGWIIAGCAIVLAVATWLMRDWAGMPRPEAQLQERDLLVLTCNLPTGFDGMRDATRLAVAAGLEASAAVRVMSDVQARQLLAYMGRRSDEAVTREVARDLCQRAGSPGVVGASVTALRSGFLVGIEAEACGSGETLARGQLEASSRDDVPRAARRLTALLAAALQSELASRRARPARPLVLASTASLPALQALSLGDAERVRGNAAEAVRLYERAIELDPQFATAYARLGSLQAFTVASIHPTTAGRRAASDDRRRTDYLRRAFELRDRASEPERFHIAALYHAWVARDVVKALESLEAWTRLYPGSAIPAFEMARLHSAFFGNYELAIAEAREALRLAPGDVVSLIALADACLGANRFPEARAAIEEGVRRAPALYAVRAWRYLLAVMADDEAAAEAEMRWASGDQAIGMEFARFRAQRAMAAGRMQEAAVLWTRVREWNAARGYDTSVAGARANEALWRVWAGEPHGAAEIARAAANSSDHPLVQLEAGVALALAGDAAAARAIAARFRSTFPDDHLLASQVFVPTLDAALALAAGRPDQALDTLRSTEPYELAKAFRLLPLALRARATLAAGRWPEAVAACTRLVEHRAVHPTTIFWPLAYRDLAQALRRAGDSRRADEAERRFRQLWSGPA